MLELAERLGCVGARHRPLRPDRRRRRGAAARRRRRPRQGPDLHALRPAPGSLGAAALPARRADQAARCASSPPRAGLPVAAQGREPGPLLSRRRGQALVPRPPRRARRAPGRRSSTAAAAVSAATAATTASPSASAAGSAAARTSRSTCSPPTPRPTRVVVGSREELATTGSRVREATLHRPGGRVDAVRLRYHSRPLACELPPVARRRSRGARARARRARLRRRAGPDRLPAGRRRWSSAARRSPAADATPTPRLALDDAPTRSARPSCPSSSSAATCACRRRRWSRPPTTPRPCSRSPGMQPFKPYFEGREEPPTPPADLLAAHAFAPPDIEEVGNDHAPPHLLRDARQLLDSATTSRPSRCATAGSSRSRASASTRS